MGTTAGMSDKASYLGNGGEAPAATKQTELASRLRHSGVTDVYILGLATDYCVKYTALDSRKLEFETWLIPDGTRAINIKSGDDQRAITEMNEAGVHVAGPEFLYG
jgi:nicotinamidase/pyrazinamidase